MISLDVSSKAGFNGQMEDSHHLHWCGNISYNISGSSCCNGRRDSCSCNFVIAELLKVEDVIRNEFRTYTNRFNTCCLYFNVLQVI